ncbi:MAG: hypothetical protein AAB551_01415 [Patescibacteria group bacterium]
MKSVDVINVAGLLMDGKNDGLESELRRLGVRSVRTFAPTPRESAREHPRYAIERLMGMIQLAVQEIQKEFGEPNILLCGRSYGGFMALQAALGMDFDSIFRVVPIEAPLHPDVPVPIPSVMKFFADCSVHYDERSRLAQRAVDHLGAAGTSRLVLVQGGAEDAMVPNAAHVLPGDFETIEFSSDAFDFGSAERGSGLVVKLPDHLGRRMDWKSRFLPPGLDRYANHLFWSDDKMDAVMKIIQSAATSPTS